MRVDKSNVRNVETQAIKYLLGMDEFASKTSNLLFAPNHKK